jgi:hypothetical protein
MKLKFHSIWGALPVPVLSVHRLPGRLVGVSLGAAIIVRSDYHEDWPTIVHELEHCKQFWRGGLVVHFLRYYMSRLYRLKSELSAFGAELAACDPHEQALRLDDAARALASGYRIGLDVHACRYMLTRRLSAVRQSDSAVAGSGWRLHRIVAARVRAR